MFRMNPNLGFKILIGKELLFPVRYFYNCANFHSPTEGKDSRLCTPIGVCVY